MVKFGTSGLRGLSDDLTDDLVARYVVAFLGLVPRAEKLLIGRDLRQSSPRIAEAVAQAARAKSVTPVDCGVLPTPALALAATSRGLPAVMVTGSHIPADRNGLKFYRPSGEIEKSDETEIVKAAVAAEVPEIPEDAPEAETDSDAAGAYLRRLADFFGERALSGWKVGVWEQSGAARDILPELLAALGAEVVSLDRSETFVPVDTEALDATLRSRLRGWVGEHGLDAIVSTDGDADRPMLADEEGSVIPGDILGALTARFLGARHVVTPVSSNTLVDEMGTFQQVDRVRIGSPYVIAGMKAALADENSGVVGYEPNGGFLTGDTITREGRDLSPLMTRDSALPAIATMAAAEDSGLTLSRLVARLPKRRTATDRLQDVPQDISDRLARRALKGDLAVLPDGLGKPLATDTTDGARITFVGGEIVTVRPSGNAPELRCYVEAESDARAQTILAEALAKLRSAVDQECG